MTEPQTEHRELANLRIANKKLKADIEHYEKYVVELKGNLRHEAKRTKIYKDAYIDMIEEEIRNPKED